MNKEKVLRRLTEKRPISLIIKITKSQSDFMRKENLSPTAILNEALNELGFKEA